MIFMKNFENSKEMRKALYALKLFGITAEAYYAGERVCNSDMKVNGVGAELSPEEYKRVLMERAEKVSQLEQETIQKKKEALISVPGWMQRAANYMDPDKLSKFLDYTMKSIDGELHGQDVADALDVADFVKGNTCDNYDIMQYLKNKKTPYFVLVRLVNDYFYTGFYTSMETVRGMQYHTK